MHKLGEFVHYKSVVLIFRIAWLFQKTMHLLIIFGRSFFSQSTSYCAIMGKIFRALVNEDMMFLRVRKLRNICCGHKMFLNKIKNKLCVPDTNLVSATNVSRAGKRGNICVGNNVSATMCPRLPGLSKMTCTVLEKQQNFRRDVCKFLLC